MQNSLFEAQNYIEEVRNQYENYPYPHRDPQDEKEAFTYTPGASLELLNHYHYGGKQDFSNGYRALVAGGGTGDAIVTLAEQCRHKDTQLVYLDISKASMEVAKSRLKVRGLEDRVEWINGSLLDSEKLFNEKFDYINCTGVLHHLESPEDGLKSLSSVLKDDGVMTIMLYAKYGRENIYKIQDLMKILNKDIKSMQQKIDNCKVVLNSFPQNIPNQFNDVENFGDIGIYDLFLHSHDVAYTVPKIYEFVKSENLKLTHFCHSDRNVLGNNLYKLETYIKDDALLKQAENLTIEEKQAAAELLNGKISKHVFFVARNESNLSSTEDLENVPFLSMIINEQSYDNIYQMIRGHNVGEQINCLIFGLSISFVKTENTELLFKYIDGNRSLGEIFSLLRKEYKKNKEKPTVQILQKEFENIYKAFLKYDWMLLRHKNVPKLDNLTVIQQRLK